MKRTELSVYYDGEPMADRDAVTASLENSPERRRELAAMRWLSVLLAVDEVEPDPSFVARFRAHRDELVEVGSRVGAWRWIALRLAPLTAGALVAAGIVIGLGAESNGALGELEERELWHGIEEVTAAGPVADPLLGIAIEAGGDNGQNPR